MTKSIPKSNQDNPILDSVESSTVNPTDTIISTDESTETLVEVATTKTTSNTKSKVTKPRTKTTTTKGTNRVSKKPTHNKIDLSFFDEQEKLVDTTKTYYYENGIDSIEYYPIFDQLKKDALFVELVNTIAYCENNNIDYLKVHGAVHQYTYFLCIKYFTELYPHFEGLSVEDHIAYCVKLYKTGHFELFISEILPFEELQKVMDMLKIAEHTANLIAKDEMLRNKQIDETIQSEFLRDKLKNGMIN